MSGNEFWTLADTEQIWERKQVTTQYKKIPLIVLLRIRNEELLLEDTLNHISSFADFIVVYDDASTDQTREILKAHSKVSFIIENNTWLTDVESRLLSETRHRGLLLQEARKRWDFNWCMCCDADERYEGNIREFVTDVNYESKPDGVKISLFDAYMTAFDCEPYRKGQALLGFRSYFGPECRNILMLWKNNINVSFLGLDSREPSVSGNIDIKFKCQHYGKSLSIKHWEDTCEYYVNHFPYDTYGKKWESRKGKAIHDISDFDRPLYEWGNVLFANKIENF